jgi:hypothetical protein
MYFLFIVLFGLEVEITEINKCTTEHNHDNEILSSLLTTDSYLIFVPALLSVHVNVWKFFAGREENFAIKIFKFKFHKTVKK